LALDIFTKIIFYLEKQKLHSKTST
jgi:hypothetical protein